MSTPPPKPARWIRGTGVLAGVVAVLLLVLSSLGISNLPLFLPLLLLVAASGLVLASRNGSS